MCVYSLILLLQKDHQYSAGYLRNQRHIVYGGCTGVASSAEEGDKGKASAEARKKAAENVAAEDGKGKASAASAA